MRTRDEEIGEAARALHALRRSWESAHRILDALALLIKDYEDRLKQLTKE